MKLQVLNSAWIWAVPWMMLDTRQGGLRSVVPHRRWESKSTPQALSQRRQAEMWHRCQPGPCQSWIQKRGLLVSHNFAERMAFRRMDIFLGVLWGFGRVTSYIIVQKSLSHWICGPKPSAGPRRGSCATASMFASDPAPSSFTACPGAISSEWPQSPFFQLTFLRFQLRRSALLLFFGNSHGI